MNSWLSRNILLSFRLRMTATGLHLSVAAKSQCEASPIRSELNPTYESHACCEAHRLRACSLRKALRERQQHSIVAPPGCLQCQEKQTLGQRSGRTLLKAPPVHNARDQQQLICFEPQPHHRPTRPGGPRMRGAARTRGAAAWAPATLQAFVLLLLVAACSSLSLRSKSRDEGSDISMVRMLTCHAGPSLATMLPRNTPFTVHIELSHVPLAACLA